MEFLRILCSIIVKPICFIIDMILYRVKIEGIENIPKNQACIICGNHVHALDAPVLLARTNKKIRFMAKQELWKSPAFRFMAFIYQVFPVKRDKKDTDAVKTALKILKKGEILGIYPEGTRNGMVRGIKPKKGAVNLAIRGDVPIIPFGIKGNFKPFRKVRYKFGEPIYYSEYKDRAKDKDFVEDLTMKLMEKVVELRDA